MTAGQVVLLEAVSGRVVARRAVAPSGQRPMPTLAKARANTGFSRTALAARSGVSVTMIARIERGQTRPCPRVVTHLSRALGAAPEAVTEFRSVAFRTQLPQPVVRPALQHLLVLDASPAVLDALRDLLEGEGYRVWTGASTQMDLETIARLAPDLILLEDVEATTGGSKGLLQMLRADSRTRAVPLILGTSAGGDAAEMEQQLAEPGLWVVSRPFDLDALLGVVRAAIRPLAAKA